jgi:hypothetical protein
MTKQLESALSNIQTSLTPGVLFDSNVFNKLILDDNIKHLPQNIQYYATKIQYDEICNIPDAKFELRQELLSLFTKVPITIIESADKEWFSFNKNFHNARFMAQGEYEQYKYLSNSNVNHLNDAITIITSIHYDFILVSGDKKTPFKRAKKLKYRIITFSDFMNEFSPSI